MILWTKEGPKRLRFQAPDKAVTVKQVIKIKNLIFLELPDYGKFSYFSRGHNLGWPSLSSWRGKVDPINLLRENNWPGGNLSHTLVHRNHNLDSIAVSLYSWIMRPQCNSIHNQNQTEQAIFINIFAEYNKTCNEFRLEKTCYHILKRLLTLFWKIATL